MSLLFILGMFLTLAVSAKLPLTYLRDLVGSANWIVIGTVVAIEDGGMSKEYKLPTKKVQIFPKSFIKGVKQETLIITFMPNLSEKPDLSLNETYLLFLENTPSGVEVCIGYLGALKIKDGFVKTSEIHGELESQDIDMLVDRIRVLIQDEICTHQDPM